MAEIAVLTEEVINQIAAGEVVERPASVVKELVENSIDAGARCIRIETDGGGKRLIRVVDDGCGMTPAEVEVALLRHATSKLRVLADLDFLGTLGFRGEALPSIASVSRMVVATRARSEEAGIEMEITAGRVLARRDIGCPTGTRIEVHELFENVPARRKFLKGDATESALITDVIQKLALAHPEVDFSLKHRSRTSVRAPVVPSGLERVGMILGARFSRQLFPIEGEEGGIRVEAYLAAPDLAQTTSRGLILLVGRRAVRDRGLAHAVLRGYGELVPRGRYPVAVVRVDVPPMEIDVNVHPQKLEVRFSDAQRVYSAVRHVIGRGLSGAPWLAEAARGSPLGFGTAVPLAMASGGAGQVTRVASQVAAAQAEALSFPWRNERARSSRSCFKTTEEPQPQGAGGPQSSSVLDVRESFGGTGDAADGARRGFETTSRPPERTERESGVAIAESRAPAAETPVTGVPPGVRATPVSAGVDGFFAGLKYIGQLDRTFLLCERPGEMILVDQHAAHERVVFERLRASQRGARPASQPLLFPQTIDVSAEEVAAVESFAEELFLAGFEVEPFGQSGRGETLALKATPAGLRAEPSTVLLQLLRELSAFEGSRALEERMDLVLATVACHSSVRAGDALSESEVAALFEDLDRTPYRANCPHGRPVLLRISVGELARRFGR